MNRYKPARRNPNVMLAILVFGLVAALTLLIAGSVGLSVWQCSNRWVDYNHEYRAFSGCMVEIDGRMTPEDKVRF